MPVDLTIQVLLNSLSTKQIDYLKEVHLAVVDEEIYKKLVEECEKLNITSPASETNEASGE